MKRVLAILALALLATAVLHLYILLELPPEKTLGEIYKILYVHVPPIWVAYVFFVTALVSSVLFTVKRLAKYDALAYSSVLLGVVLSGLAILLGSIFAREAWGTYWEWSEPRMTSTLILFLAYLGYLVLRSSIDDIQKKREISAVYSIMAFITVPMSYVSVKMFRSLHPLPELAPIMKYALLATFLVNLLIFSSLLKILYNIVLWEDRKIEGGDFDAI